MRHLHQDLLAVEVADHLGEELGVEANVHRLAFILAGNTLVGLVREFQVFGRNLQPVVAYGEAHLTGGFAGEDAHAAQRVEEREPVEDELVGVVLRYGGFVVRVATVDEAAHDVEVVEGDEDVGIVVFYRHVAVVFPRGQYVLDDGDGLLGQDEVRALLAAHVFAAVADQLVRVGGHEGHPVGGHLAEDAAHLLVHLVVAGGKVGLVDGLYQCAAAHVCRRGALGGRHGGVGVGVHTSQVVLALARGNGDGVALAVDVEGQGHVVEALQDLKEHLRRNRHLFGLLHAAGLHLETRHEGRAEVRGLHHKAVLLQVEMEAPYDGHRVVVRKHAAERLQLFQELLAVDYEIHDVTDVVFCTLIFCKDTYIPLFGTDPAGKLFHT